jgi:hypothetical protein
MKSVETASQGKADLGVGALHVQSKILFIVVLAVAFDLRDVVVL